MRGFSIASALVLAMTGAAVLAEGTAAPAVPTQTASTAAYSSTMTPMGVLLGNPATKAVLLKMLPELVARMGDNMERVSGMTLKEIQEATKAYAPDALSDTRLSAIDVELAKVPVTE